MSNIPEYALSKTHWVNNGFYMNISVLAVIVALFF